MEKNVVVSHCGWNKKITFLSTFNESDASVVKRKIYELLETDPTLQQLVGGREFLLQAHDKTVDMMTNIDHDEPIPDRARLGLSILNEAAAESAPQNSMMHSNYQMQYGQGEDTTWGSSYSMTNGKQQQPGKFNPNETRCNLIINYLPQHMSDDELTHMFINIGPLKNAKIMRDRETGYSFGYGFVEYMSPLDAVRAINELNGYQIMHKQIKVSYARPPGESIKGTNLYVVNLPTDITQDRLDAMFQPYGTIVQSHLLINQDTGLPRGIAFVRFDKKEEAEAAIKEINGYTPPGASKEISVRVAKDRSKENQDYYMGWQTSGMMRPHGRGGFTAPRRPRFRGPGAMRHMRPSNRYNPMGPGQFY